MGPRRKIARTFFSLTTALASMAVMSPGAVAAGPPSASTGAATELLLTSVVFSGTVDANEESTLYWFEYGKTTAYGNSTPKGGISFAKEPKAVEQLAVALDPETTYHYRLVAENKYGISKGADQQTPSKTLAWHIEGQTFPELELKGESYESEGSFTMEIPTLEITFDCDEAGIGTIEIEEQLALDCDLVGLEEICEVEPIALTLDRRFKVPSGSTLTTIITNGEECPWPAEVLVAHRGFKVESGPEAKLLSVSLSETTFFGQEPMYLSGTSTWALSGARAGQSFGIG